MAISSWKNQCVSFLDSPQSDGNRGSADEPDIDAMSYSKADASEDLSNKLVSLKLAGSLTDSDGCQVSVWR